MALATEPGVHYVWTYPWYVQGYDDDIYWDKVTVEWYGPGCPTEEAIKRAILEQHDIEPDDLDIIRIFYSPQVEIINQRG